MSTKNTMKHNAVITTMLLLVLFTFSACASVTPDDQTSKDSNITENGASTGCSDYDNTSTPEFFNDLGKTLTVFDKGIIINHNKNRANLH